MPIRTIHPSATPSSPELSLVLCCVCPGALLFLGSCSVHPQMHCQRVRLMYGVSCVSSGRARDNFPFPLYLPSHSMPFHSVPWRSVPSLAKRSRSKKQREKFALHSNASRQLTITQTLFRPMGGQRQGLQGARGGGGRGSGCSAVWTGLSGPQSLSKWQ